MLCRGSHLPSSWFLLPLRIWILFQLLFTLHSGFFSSNITNNFLSTLFWPKKHLFSGYSAFLNLVYLLLLWVFLHWNCKWDWDKQLYVKRENFQYTSFEPRFPKCYTIRKGSLICNKLFFFLCGLFFTLLQRWDAPFSCKSQPLLHDARKVKATSQKHRTIRLGKCLQDHLDQQSTQPHHDHT